ncbi:MAG: DUF2799 domain-containing protein [Methylomonas sp.]|nr:DUF2799 domain-containing protein [Methylomonas sp.]
MRRIIGFSIVLAQLGCATLSREECMRGDWYGVGVADGRSGQIGGRVDEHRKACVEYGIIVNHEAYFAGRELGLRDYCQLDNAFRAGLNGEPYRHVCPPAIDGLFAQYHAAAYAVYEVRTELERLDNELSGRERDLYDKKLSDKDRTRIRQDIRELDRNRDRLRDDLYYHERQLDHLRHEASPYH